MIAPRAMGENEHENGARGDRRNRDGERRGAER